jgi:hypothetical protein
MKTTRAWGWLATGVLALVVNGWYHDGGAQWAHVVIRQVTHRTAALLDSASSRADQFLEELLRALRVESK